MPVSRAIAPGLFTTDDDGPRLVAGRCDACGRLQEGVVTNVQAIFFCPRG